jgi:hypothetical protein
MAGRHRVIVQHGPQAVGSIQPPEAVERLLEHCHVGIMHCHRDDDVRLVLAGGGALR